MEERDDKDDAVHTPNADRPVDPWLGLGHNTAIGKRLKAYYDDVASEPVPDRFLMLLDALDAAESGSKKSGDE